MSPQRAELPAYALVMVITSELQQQVEAPARLSEDPCVWIATSLEGAHDSAAMYS